MQRNCLLLKPRDCFNILAYNMNIFARLALLAVVLFCGSALARQTVYVTRNSPSYNCPNYLLNGAVSAAGQIAVAIEPVLTPTVRTYTRNATGFYNNVSRLAVDAGSGSIDTNGKWYSYLHPRGHSLLWQVDVNNQIVNLQTVADGGVFAHLLIDNTYVVVHFDYIDSYTWSNSAWNRVDRTYYRNNSLNHMLPFFGLSETGQSFVIVSPTYMDVQLYNRKGYSWTYIEDIPLNLSLGIAKMLVPIGNGQDTMISTYYNYGPNNNVPAGAVVVHTKRNGRWQQSVTTAIDLGLIAPAALGTGVLVVNRNNVIVGAPFDNYNEAASTGGRMLLMSRQFDNSWKFVTDYVTSDAVVLGNAVTKNNQDLIIGGGRASGFGGTCWMYSTSLPN